MPGPFTAGEKRSRDLAELLADLLTLGRTAAGDLPRTCALAAAAAEVEQLAREPLRVAVLGRPGDGALMLAETLLGRRVFERRALRRVTGPVWFRFADEERVTLMGSGSPTELTTLPVPDAAWPTPKPRSVEVALRAPQLRRMSLVVADAVPATAVSAAVVVAREPAEVPSLDLLDRFHERGRGLEPTAFAAMAVQRTDDVRAEHVVERRQEYRPRAAVTASLVLPVNLRMAHSVRVGAFDENALAALHDLLARNDVDIRIDRGRLAPILNQLLTVEGLRACLPALPGRSPTLAELREVALAVSGFDAFAEAVRNRWLANGDALKVATVRGVLAGAAGRSAFATPAEQAAGGRLSDALTAIGSDRLRPLDEIQALHLLRGGRLGFSAADTDTALRLLETGRPRIRLAPGGGVADGVEALVLRWRALADSGIGGGPLQRWAASIVLHAAESVRSQVPVGRST